MMMIKGRAAKKIMRIKTKATVHKIKIPKKRIIVKVTKKPVQVKKAMIN